jgi:hypothetical protein
LTFSTTMTCDLSLTSVFFSALVRLELTNKRIFKITSQLSTIQITK